MEDDSSGITASIAPRGQLTHLTTKYMSLKQNDHYDEHMKDMDEEIQKEKAEQTAKELGDEKIDTNLRDANLVKQNLKDSILWLRENFGDVSTAVLIEDNFENIKSVLTMPF
jgi:hypothetical protein